MRQRGLTFISRIKTGEEENLRVFLNQIGKKINNNGIIDFAELKTVHFMRWVIVPAANIRGENLPAQLALSTNFDGKETEHLKELVREAGNALNLIYQKCENWPVNASANDMLKYLRKHKRKNAAFYNGSPGRTSGQIHKESALREAIGKYLQTSNPSQDWTGQPSMAIRSDIVQAISSKKQFDWLTKRYKPTFLQRFGIALLAVVVLIMLSGLIFGFVLGSIIPACIIGVLVIGAGLWLLILRVHEKQDRINFEAAPRDAQQLAELTHREDFKVQNQITHLVIVKKGLFR